MSQGKMWTTEMDDTVKVLKVERNAKESNEMEERG